MASGSARSQPVLILAGGKGTRLQAVNPTRPKPMVLVSGRPFLYYIFRNYAEQGFSRFLVSTGHMAEVIETHPWRDELPGLTIEFYREAAPLGTGGAVAEIFTRAPKLQSCWIVNGDTLIPAALPTEPVGADAAVVSLPPGEIADASPNLVARGDRIVGTVPPVEGAQPRKDGDHLVFDSGVAFLTRKAVEACTARAPFSFHQLLGPSLAAGAVKHLQIPGTCYDIGTPERLMRFESYLSGKETR